MWVNDSFLIKVGRRQSPVSLEAPILSGTSGKNRNFTGNDRNAGNRFRRQHVYKRRWTLPSWTCGPNLGRTVYIPHESYKQEKNSLRSTVSCTFLFFLCLIYYVDMTEYDYSPDAYKRHLASQEKIARWVDETLEQSPCNPFEPLPLERSFTQTPQPAFHTTHEGDISPTYYSNSRTHRERSTNKTPQPAFHATHEGDISSNYHSNSRTHRERSSKTPQPAFHATPEGDISSNYYSNSRTHRERSSKTPQSAFHATPEGDISPTYYSNSRTHRRDEHSSQWHQNPSQQSNTPGTPFITPQTRPGFGRSFTTPNTSSAGQYLPQSQYPTATPSRIPATPSRIPSPYNSRHSSRHQPSPMPHHRSSSQNSFRSVHSPHHSPHVHASPVIHDGGNTYPYFSPRASHPPQPMLQQQQQHVFHVREDRNFTVVPPSGHHVHVLVRFLYNYHILFVVIHSIT
jgi:hypothetical protein